MSEDVVVDSLSEVRGLLEPLPVDFEGRLKRLRLYRKFAKDIGHFALNLGGECEIALVGDRLGHGYFYSSPNAMLFFITHFKEIFTASVKPFLELGGVGFDFVQAVDDAFASGGENSLRVGLEGSADFGKVVVDGVEATEDGGEVGHGGVPFGG